MWWRASLWRCQRAHQIPILVLLLPREGPGPIQGANSILRSDTRTRFPLLTDTFDKPKTIVQKRHHGSARYLVKRLVAEIPVSTLLLPQHTRADRR